MKANAAALLISLLLCAPIAHAQRDLLGVEEVAEAFVMMTTPTWRGPRVPVPDEQPRPQVDRLAESASAPLVVHAHIRTPTARVRRALGALEFAYRALGAEGWPVAATDGLAGGGGEWDLYLAPAQQSAVAYSDGRKLWTYRDRASTFAVVDESLPNAALAACVTDAFVRAVLLAYDPAEAQGWRAATAAWLTWRLTGEFGCQDAGADYSRNAAAGWIGREHGEAGGVMLAMLSSRHDDGNGSFVRGLWDLASQRTWDGQELRADPDLWAALEALLGAGGGDLDQSMIDFATARYFTGRQSAFPTVTRALHGNGVTPTRTLTRLPSKMVSSVALEPYGSGYVLSAPLNGVATLRAWLRGEYGVRWSMVFVQLDEAGRDIGQVAAAPTEGTPNAFLPVSLAPDTVRVLVVVTNLSSRRPDADMDDANLRSFEVTLAPGDG